MKATKLERLCDILHGPQQAKSLFVDSSCRPSFCEVGQLDLVFINGGILGIENDAAVQHVVALSVV